MNLILVPERAGPDAGMGLKSSAMDDQYLKILVVDDKPASLKLVRESLSPLNVVVHLALSGMDALRYCRDNHYVLFILDVQMPAVDGYQTAQLLRNLEQTRERPIIFLTEKKLPQDLICEGYGYGAIDVLLKPVDTQILRAKVNTFIQLDQERRKVEKQARALRIANDELRDVNRRLQSEIFAHTQTRDRLEIVAEESMRANVLKTRFLANMSHEIRTPLNGVLSVAELLLDTELDEEQHELVRVIVDSGTSLLHVLSQTLELSRIEANALSLEVAPFDLPSMVERVVRLFEEEIKSKGLSFNCHLDLPAKGNQSYVGDDHGLEDILKALLGNAVKFTHQGGIELLVRGQLTDGPTERITFAITDTGIGIPPNMLEAIFDPFTRAETPSQMLYQGLGLGLTIAQRMAGMMDGVIRVTSKPNQGSTFLLSLALPPVSASRSPCCESLACRLPLRILIAEPEEATHSLVDKALRKFGYQAIAARSSQEALLHLAHHEVDLVFIDLGLYTVAESDLCREISQLNSVPPVFVALGQPTIEVQATDPLTLMDFLTKPYNLKDIEAIIEKWGPRIGGLET